VPTEGGRIDTGRQVSLSHSASSASRLSISLTPRLVYLSYYRLSILLASLYLSIGECALGRITSRYYRG